MREKATACRAVFNLAVNPDLIAEWADEVGALEEAFVSSRGCAVLDAIRIEALEAAIEFVVSGYELLTDEDGELRYRHVEKKGAFLPAPESLKRLSDALKENTNA